MSAGACGMITTATGETAAIQSGAWTIMLDSMEPEFTSRTPDRRRNRDQGVGGLATAGWVGSGAIVSSGAGF